MRWIVGVGGLDGWCSLAPVPRGKGVDAAEKVDVVGVVGLEADGEEVAVEGRRRICSQRRDWSQVSNKASWLGVRGGRDMVMVVIVCEKTMLEGWMGSSEWVGKSSLQDEQVWG